MPNKNRKTPNRIPVRFVDSAEAAERDGEDGPAAAPAGPSSEKTGSELTEDLQQSAGLAEEQRAETARDRDAENPGDIGGSESPGRLNDLDATATGGAAPSQASVGDGGSPSNDGPVDASTSSADLAYGPMMAELIATRSELRRVESELKKLAAEKLDLTDKLARRQADFENYRKRIDRERSETSSRVVGDVVGRLLPVLDNLSRALAAEASVEAGESEEFRHFLHGIELIEKQLAGLLGSLGVEAVPTVGEKFDPHVHEAVTTVQTDEVEPDTVMEEMRRGYRLGNKLLRPAMVKVSK